VTFASDSNVFDILCRATDGCMWYVDHIRAYGYCTAPKVCPSHRCKMVCLVSTAFCCRDAMLCAQARQDVQQAKKPIPNWQLETRIQMQPQPQRHKEGKVTNELLRYVPRVRYTVNRAKCYHVHRTSTSFTSSIVCRTRQKTE
jgi:hypothetical protein